MEPEEYILKVKEQFGTQYTSDGQLIRDMNDKKLLEKMLQRYPSHAHAINNLDEYLSSAEKAAVAQAQPEPKSFWQKYTSTMDKIRERVIPKIEQEYLAGGQKMIDSVAQGADRLEGGVRQALKGDIIGGAYEAGQGLTQAGVGAAAGAARSVWAPVTGAAGAGMDAAADNASVQGFAMQPGVSAGLDAVNEGIAPAVEAGKQFAEANPDLTRNAIDFATAATAGVGGPGALGTAGRTTVAQVAGAGLDAAGTATRVATAPVRTAARVVAAPVRRALPTEAKAVAAMEGTYRELFTNNVSNSRKYNKAESVTGMKNNAGTEGDTPSRVLAEQGIIPNIDGNQFRTADQAADLSRKARALRAENRASLEEVQRQTSPIELSAYEQRVLDMANSDFNINRGTATGLIAEIKAAFADLRAARGDTLNLTVLDDIKAARWSKAPFDSTRPLQGDANYLMAKTAQQIIEETAESVGATGVAQINRSIGDIIESAKWLGSLEGRTVPANILSRFSGRALGTALGLSQSGAMGGLIGLVGGDLVANLLRSWGVANPATRLMLRNLEKRDPAGYAEVMKWLSDQETARSGRLALPAPDGDTPIPLGAPENRAQVIQGQNARPEWPALPAAGPDTPIPMGPSSQNPMTVITGSYDDFLKAQGLERTNQASAIDYALRSTRENGGATVSIFGKIPEEGFSFAPSKATERAVPVAEFTPDTLAKYVDEWYDELSQPDTYIGTWEWEGQIYMDVSRVLPDEQAAVAQALVADQIGIYDLKTGTTKETGNYTLQDGVYRYGGEEQGGNPGGSDGERPQGGIPEGQEEIGSPGFNQGAIPEIAPRTRELNLTEADTKVKAAADAKVAKERETLIDAYLAENGNIVNTDNARKLFEDVGYNGRNSAAVHAASKSVSDGAFDRLVARATPGQDAFFMSGGSGAGKSSATRQFQDRMSGAAIVFDGNLSSYGSAMQKIRAAEKAGLNVTIPYVYRDAPEAWGGVMGRMLGNGPDAGRIVPLTVFLENTPGALSTVKRLGDEGIPVYGVNNSFGPGKAEAISLSEIKELSYPATMQEDLIKLTEDWASEGRMTKEQYEALLAGLEHRPFEALQNTQ